MKLSEEDARQQLEEERKRIEPLLLELKHADCPKCAQLETDNAALQAAVGGEMRAKERAQLQRDALQRQTGICEWWHDEDSDVWTTSCSNLWVFTNDGPKENDCHYCMYCGGVLEVIEAEVE